MDPRYKLYCNFKDAFVAAHSDLKKELALKRAQEQWNSIKRDNEEVTKWTKLYHSKAADNKGRLLSMWARASVPRTQTTADPKLQPSTSTAADDDDSETQMPSDTKEEEPAESTTSSVDAADSGCSQVQRSTPAQDGAKEKLNDVNAKLAGLAQAKSSGLWTEDMKAQAAELSQSKQLLEKRLKRLAAEQTRKRKFRQDFKRKLSVIAEENPAVGERLKKIRRQEVGRPRVEDDQPDLLKAIVDIVCAGAAADERRRSEKLSTCKTLDDLHEALLEQGFTISRSGTYLRLLPRNSITNEGKRHVTTVPVKLLKATNTARRNHDDAHFAAATVRYLKDVAVIMGAECAFFLSQDDKARVPLGLPSANKQSPILMHLEYKVQLPDHDWVIAERHKLIPSVYAACIVKSDSVSYSGPTAIYIRSGKHDSSSAATHAADFEALKTVPAFQSVMCTDEGVLKPVVIITADGGPDENPRFPKTLAAAYRTFIENNLDAIFVACHAPGQSAYNAVERRMAPLSRDLSGLILPHDYYGSHLDHNGKTSDPELEKSNFAKAGDALAEVWSATVIDGHTVTASYVPAENGKIALCGPTEDWASRHVQQSQYCLQIVKCNDVECCGQRRSDFNNVFAGRFLPPPIPYRNTKTGIEPANTSSEGNFGSLYQRMALSHLVPPHDFVVIPFDLYCPSLQNTLTKRICKHCSAYFPSQAAMKKHLSVHKQPCNQSVEDDEPAEATESISSNTLATVSDANDGLPVVRNLFDWLQSAFVETD